MTTFYRSKTVRNLYYRDVINIRIPLMIEIIQISKSETIRNYLNGLDRSSIGIFFRPKCTIRMEMYTSFESPARGVFVFFIDFNLLTVGVFILWSVKFVFHLLPTLLSNCGVRHFKPREMLIYSRTIITRRS